MPRQVAAIEPSVLRWARETSAVDLEEAARRLSVHAERLRRAEEGDPAAALTLNQARKAASIYGRPFAVLFLPKPPADTPPEVRFRRLSDAPPLPWSHEMILLARRVNAIQDEALTVFDAIEEDVAWPGVRTRVAASPPKEQSAVIRADLDVPVGDQKRAASGDHAGFAVFRLWREVIEDTGVLVLQDGTLPVAEMRGFLAKHDRVPAIVLNTKDIVKARLFTMLHEFVHLLLPRAGEAECEELAGEVLFPAAEVQKELAALGTTDLRDIVAELSKRFGLTRHAVAVRLHRLGIADPQKINAIIRDLKGQGEPAGPGGGNYYQNVLARLGRGLTKRALEAVEIGAMSPLAAARLMGVRVEKLGEIRQKVWGPGPAE